MNWKPPQIGRYTLQCRATNAAGATQRTNEWNHGGYQRRVIETREVEVTA